ncbi:hypothetical protein WD374_002328 [Vibrio vulnificus]|nr:hypothetical protein [Vibrio vulnificus]EKM6954031.1 hypothetical protein [Vibrio parahaemolyticus]
MIKVEYVLDGSEKQYLEIPASDLESYDSEESVFDDIGKTDLVLKELLESVSSRLGLEYDHQESIQSSVYEYADKLGFTRLQGELGGKSIFIT